MTTANRNDIGTTYQGRDGHTYSNGTPPPSWGIARCYPAGHNGRSLDGTHLLAWRGRTGASVGNVPCPIHPNASNSITTRQSRGAWLIVDDTVVSTVAKAARDAKRAKVAEKEEDGTLRKVRDLEAGQVIYSPSRQSVIDHGVKVVSVERLAGGKVRLVTTRSLDDALRQWRPAGVGADGIREQVIGGAVLASLVPRWNKDEPAEGPWAADHRAELELIEAAKAVTTARTHAKSSAELLERYTTELAEAEARYYPQGNKGAIVSRKRENLERQAAVAADYAVVAETEWAEAIERFEPAAIASAVGLATGLGHYAKNYADLLEDELANLTAAPVVDDEGWAPGSPAAVYGADTFEEADDPNVVGSFGEELEDLEPDVEALFDDELRRLGARNATPAGDVAPITLAGDLVVELELTGENMVELGLAGDPADRIGEELLLAAGTEVRVLELLPDLLPPAIRLSLEHLGRLRVKAFERALELGEAADDITDAELARVAALADTGVTIVEPELLRRARLILGRRFGPRELVELKRPLVGHPILKGKANQGVGGVNLAHPRNVTIPGGLEVELIHVAPGDPPAVVVRTYGFGVDPTDVLVRLAELEDALELVFEAPTAAEVGA